MDQFIKIKGILDKLDDGILVIDQHKIVQYANPLSENLLQKNQKELIHKKFEYPILKSGYNELEIETKKDEVIYLELHYEEISWENNESTLIIIKDVTESKLIEIELLKQSEKFQSFYDFSPLCMQSLNNNGIILNVNPAWMKTLGYKKTQVIGKSFSDFLHEDFKDGYKLKFEEFKKRGHIKDVYYKLKKNDSTYIDAEFEGTIGYNSMGEIEQTYCVFKDISRQKEVEKDLNRKIENLNEAEDASKIGHWELDLLKNSFYCSDQVFKIFEIEKDENSILHFKDYLSIVHPDDRIFVQQEYQKSVKENRSEMIEHRIVVKNKNIKFVQSKFKTEYNQKGQPVRSFGMIQDITESKNAQKTLIESEELYRELFESESDAIFLIENETSQILEANIAATNMYGFTYQELLSKKNTDLSAEPDKTRDTTLKTPVIKDNVVFIPLRYHKNKKGEVFPVEITGRFFTWKNKKVHIAAIRDISIRMKTDEALKESQRTHTVLMSNLPGMAYRCKNDKDYTMIFVSDGCEQLTGYKPDELKSNQLISYDKLIHPDFKDEIWNVIQESLKSKEQYHLEYKIITRDGSEKWVWEKGIGIYSKTGAVIFLEGFISDISDLKRTEKELIFAKENAERSDKLKSSFLANMSHEIRTPMNGIVGFSKLLLNEKLSFEKRKRYVEIINNGSQQLLTIIGDILDISRIETGNIELFKNEFSLIELINNLFNMFLLMAQNKNIKLIRNIEIQNKNQFIYADKTKLQQVITNLLYNALKFTDEGEIVISCRIEDDKVIISVADTGIGISNDKLEAIFDRFNKGELDLNYKYGGTGLGLSISKAFVEMMGGKIWVESEPGKGSCFYFNMPYTEALEPDRLISQKKITKLEDIDFKKLIVLIVEDEIINFEYLKRILEELCITNIIHAKNGVEAIQLFKDNKEIDIVLMDVKLPRMDGFEATREIRKINTDVPIIAQTALTTAEDKVKALESGCNDYITKPIDNIKFTKLLENYILKQ